MSSVFIKLFYGIWRTAWSQKAHSGCSIFEKYSSNSWQRILESWVASRLKICCSTENTNRYLIYPHCRLTQNEPHHWMTAYFWKLDPVQSCFEPIHRSHEAYESKVSSPPDLPEPWKHEFPDPSVQSSIEFMDAFVIALKNQLIWILNSNNLRSALCGVSVDTHCHLEGQQCETYS